jgi:hypothetical protein
MLQETIEERINRLEAIHEVQQVMSKYEYYLAGGMGHKIASLFAQKTPGVTANIGDWGSYNGLPGIKRLFCNVIDSMMTQPGCYGEADLVNPVIEIAKDGKTAKAVWMAPGNETTRDPWDKSKIHAAWCWTKYACDFIKEDGVWRLWHLNNFLLFFADFEKSWAEGGEHYTRRKGEVREFPSAWKPDGPPLHRHQPYDPNKPMDMLPAFPEPYDTYDGSQDWIDPKKSKIKKVSHSKPG